MLIVALIKGVPARTTKLARMRGIPRREDTEIVLNPHDLKAIEASDYIKRRMGGKTVALTMGPEVRLRSLMLPLREAEVHGVDEAFIMSDPRLAGSDTLATSYVMSLGVLKVLERHAAPLDRLIELVRGEDQEKGTRMTQVAGEFYDAGLIPNKVFSRIPAIEADSIISRVTRGELSPDDAAALLESEKRHISRFVVVAGIKTTDGETGSVGPQVAEALSEKLGRDMPHATYVEDFDFDVTNLVVHAKRKIGTAVQTLELSCPCLLTMSPDYNSRPPDPRNLHSARENAYKAKPMNPGKWTADELNGEPSRFGFSGSPTIVGPAVQVGKPPIQKILDKSLVFAKKTGKLTWENKEYGPFEPGDIADSLPAPLLGELRSSGTVNLFGALELWREAFA